MPFTLSHPAAVLPFSRWLRSHHLLSAAILGSMAPDFGMLLPYHLPRSETHGLLALASFVLPVGLAGFWVHQWLIKPAVIAVLPGRLYAAAMPHARRANPGALRDWLFAIAGIVFGALTHLVWDAFTHEGARGMRMIPALDELVIGAGGHHLAGQRLMQDVSSLIGFAVIAAWLSWIGHVHRRDAAGARALGPGERAAWIGAYVVAAALFATGAMVLMHETEMGRMGLAIATNDVAVAGLRGVAASLVAVSAILDLRLGRMRGA